MKLRLRIILTAAAIAGAALMLACNDGQIDEANKLIDASNKKVAEAATLLEKTTKDAETLLSGEIDDLKEFKAKNEAKAKEIMANYDKCGEMYKAAAKDFDDAGKLKLDDKLKTYVGLKSKQLAKTGEYVSASKGGIQAFMTAEDLDAFEKQIADSKTKTEALEKEVDALSAQVKKFEAENKDVIK